jgi:hypothetical protein
MNPFKVMRMRPAKSTKFQAITSGASFVTPADWNNANNKVHCIGAGANGLVGSGTGGNAFGKAGGGGGAYAAKNNMTLSGTVVCQIGAANSGTDTFVTNAATLNADAAAVSSATGGLLANCVGDVKFAGGNGDAGGVTGGDPSGGGGGAAGPAGGQAASGMSGGAGNNGALGGGNGGSTVGGAGAAGSLWGTGIGPGGGGGGRNTTGAGGSGGNYGSGGAGGYGSSGSAGQAKGGVIVLEWTP